MLADWDLRVRPIQIVVEQLHVAARELHELRREGPYDRQPPS